MKATAKLVFLFLLLWSSGAYALDVRFSGMGNVIVSGCKSRYIILPIEESVEECTAEVINGCIKKESFTVRLAKNNVDYFVPVLVRGGDVLNIISADDRLGDYICWKEVYESDTFDTSNKEIYRPAYHHSPLYGWMNDPNGMFYDPVNELWHLYYQYNPYGSVWGNMTWGHSVSSDLIHWENKGRAINADAWGMIFSGSAVVDTANVSGFGKNAVIAMYTSAGKSQTQSISYSLDGGYTFIPYTNNPVLTDSNPDFRDPKLFYNRQRGLWSVILSCGQQVKFYSSKDFKHWTFDSSFGTGYGCHDGVWECPDLFELPVKGTKEKLWVLLVNINPGGVWGGSATQYFIGKYDGYKFTSIQKDVKWMDAGKDHYATVSFYGAPDGRTMAMAWMSNWQYANIVPTKQFRSQNSLVRDLGLYKDINGEYWLSVLPSKEYDKLSGEKLNKFECKVESDGVVVDIKDIPSVFNLDLKNISAGKAKVELYNDDNDTIKFVYDFKASSFVLERGDQNVSADFAVKEFVDIPKIKQKQSDVSFDIFLDNCSLEIFETQGRMSSTNLIFPKKMYSHIRFISDKGYFTANILQRAVNLK